MRDVTFVVMLTDGVSSGSQKVGGSQSVRVGLSQNLEYHAQNRTKGTSLVPVNL